MVNCKATYEAVHELRFILLVSLIAIKIRRTKAYIELLKCLVASTAFEQNPALIVLRLVFFVISVS